MQTNPKVGPSHSPKPTKGNNQLMESPSQPTKSKLSSSNQSSPVKSSCTINHSPIKRTEISKERKGVVRKLHPSMGSFGKNIVTEGYSNEVTENRMETSVGSSHFVTTFTYPISILETNRCLPESSNSGRGECNISAKLSPEKVTNTFTGHSPSNSSSIPINTGSSNLYMFLCILAFYLMGSKSSGMGGSIPPSPPGTSFGPPIQPPPMGATVGPWSFTVSVFTALMAYIANWIKIVTRSKIILDNPTTAFLTTAAIGVYLLRKKGILTIMGFCLSLLATFLFWKLRSSMPSGVTKLLQEGAAEITLSTESITLAIAFTVTLTAACIVALVIKLNKD